VVLLGTPAAVEVRAGELVEGLAARLNVVLVAAVLLGMMVVAMAALLESLDVAPAAAGRRGTMAVVLLVAVLLEKLDAALVESLQRSAGVLSQGRQEAAAVLAEGPGFEVAHLRFP
jgi:hypothetical protein